MPAHITGPAMTTAPVTPRSSAGARWLTALVGFAVALFVTASSPPVTPVRTPIRMNGPWITRTVLGNEISLRVPSDWNVGPRAAFAGSFIFLTGSFSNQLLSPACTTSGNSITCGQPLTSLQPGGILVDVYDNGNPTWTLRSEPGVPATVSGLSAKLDIETGGQQACGGLGADRSRTEFIAMSSPPEDYYEISICSRGVPDDVGARVMASIRVG
jgi:hypothetical protein